MKDIFGAINLKFGLPLISTPHPSVLMLYLQERDILSQYSIKDVSSKYLENLRPKHRQKGKDLIYFGLHCTLFMNCYASQCFLN